MDLLGQRTHCGPNVAAPNPRQPYLGDFTADGLDQLTLCSQSPGFGTPAAPVQPNGLQTVALCPIWRPSAPSASLLFQEVAPGDSDGGDFKADGLDQLTLCSQSPGFGTPAAPVQGHPKSVLSCRHRWPSRLFSLPNNLALSLRCRHRFQEAPLSRDFTADGLDHLTLCSQSPGFGTQAAPVQVVAPGDSDGGLLGNAPLWGKSERDVAQQAFTSSQRVPFHSSPYHTSTVPLRAGFWPSTGPRLAWTRGTCSRQHSSAAFSSSPGDFIADGLDQLTLCSQSPGFGTPAAPVQVLFKETESGQSTSVSKLTIISPDTERK
ncbi:hypothetical protein STEG23_011679 [Scotinomys teguina]